MCWMAICPGLESCNKTLIPHFQVCPNPNPFLSLAVNHLESVQTFQHSIGPPRPIYTFTWEDEQYTWTAMAHGITGDPPCFSHVLHQDLRAAHPPSKLTLFKYVGNFLLCSIIKDAFITDSIYLLQQLAEQRQCLQGGKNQFSLNTVHYLGHNVRAEEIQLPPKRIRLIQEFCRPISRQQLHGAASLTGYHKHRFLIFLH